VRDAACMPQLQKEQAACPVDRICPRLPTFHLLVGEDTRVSA
jgi:hypothetical protein